MGFSLAAVQSLFPIPLWHYRIEEEGLDPLLMAEIADRRAREPGMPNSNRLGWQSVHDLFTRKEPGHARLARLFSEVMGETLRSLEPGIDLKTLKVGLNGWVNVNPPGGYNSPHQHTDALLSGVYYVSVPKGESVNGGALELLSPHPVRQLGGLIKAPMLSERFRIRPNAGDLVIFPGQLHHWVHPNDSGQERVTIAFNAAVGRAARPGAARPRS